MGRLFDDASSQYLVSTTTPVTAAPWTMACWALADDSGVGGAGAAMSMADGSVDNHYWQLRFNPFSDRLQGVMQGGGGAVSFDGTANAFTINVWHHIAWVETASNDHAIFLDGVKTTASNPIAPSGIDQLTIGASAIATTDNYWSGVLAEAGVWNVALTEFGIFQLYQMRYAPSLVQPESLVFYRSFRADDFNHDPSEELLESPLLQQQTRHLLTNNGSTFGAHPPGIVYPEGLSFPWLFKAGVSEGDIFHHRTLRLAEHVLDESDATVVTKVGDYTVTLSDDVILSDASAGAVTITLPGADSAVNHRFYIKKIDSSANTVTVDGAGSDTIDGGATAVLTAENESITIVSDGTGWHIL